jgi:hypothetical protein
MGKVAKKVAWVGRTASMVFGLALVMALLFGIATTALAGTGVGARFQLGQTNTVNAITKLVGSVAGPSLQIDNNSTGAGATALDLQVEPGKTPMTVNSDTQVVNLNSDKLDGKSVDQIGVNGLARVVNISPANSDSPKVVTASCPAGKVVVGTGSVINGGLIGDSPNQEAAVVPNDLQSSSTTVTVSAVEDEPFSLGWSLAAQAICATAP